MKKVREKDIHGLEFLCVLIALAVIVLGVMFLFDFWQNYQFLNFILGLGTLLHVALSLLLFLRQRTMYAACALLLACFYGGVLVYFNIM